MRVKKIATPGISHLDHMIDFINGLDDTLAGARLPAELNNQIVIVLDGKPRVIASGFWELTDRVLYLADHANGSTSPDTRSRALILLTLLNHLARGYEHRAEEVSRIQQRLCTIAQETTFDGLFARCDACKSEHPITGLALSHDGRLVAVRIDSEWIAVTGESIDIETQAQQIVEW